jgi:hypothetical protein
VQKTNLTLLIILAFLTAAVGSAQSDSEGSASPPTSEAVPGAGHSTSKSVIAGKVTETLDAGRYTYVEVDTGEKRVWAAGPRIEVKVGDSVYFPIGMQMNDFESKSLGRKFDQLYMVDAIRVASSGAAMPDQGGSKAPNEVAAANIEPAIGGYTVAQIFEQKSELAGQNVSIRGRVVKFNRAILGKNWIHVQDGTAGPAGANDLVVTSTGSTKVGDIVLVRGTVVTNKDFGSGYAFDVLIEEASLSVE